MTYSNIFCLKYHFMKKPVLLIVFVMLCFGANAQTIPNYIDTNGLLGWYPFTGNANNNYGTTLNGVVIGPVLTSDRFGNPNSAYRFNGIADHILIDTAFFNVSWSNITVSWWMKSDTLDNPLSAYHDQNCFNTIPEDGFAFDMNWGRTNKYSLWVNSNPSLTGVWNIFPGSQSHDTISDHVWNHFVMIKEADSLYHLYINGALDTTYKTAVKALNYLTRFNIGNIDSVVPGEGTMGVLDDYGIWIRALGTCEVRKLFNASIHLFTTTQPANVSTPALATVHFTVVDTGTGTTLQWQENPGTGYVNLTNTGIYSGVTTATLTMTGVTSTMNTYNYRCVVSGAICVDTSDNAKLTIVTVTSVTAANAVPAITIIPNPTTGDITISGAGKTDIRVYNSVGQLIKEARNADNISIANSPAGLYVVKLFNEKGDIVYTDKIIKQ